jgi:hypothetical protein
MEQTLTPEILTAALEALEAKKKEIDSSIAEVRRMLAGKTATNTASGIAPRAHNISPAARQRMADAQKKRWAKFRKEAEARKKAAEK